MNIFDFVRQRRKELGLTQQQLADKAGVSLSVVKRFEANKPYNPRGTNFIRMAKELKVEGDFLLWECTWPRN